MSAFGCERYLATNGAAAGLSKCPRAEISELSARISFSSLRRLAMIA